MYDRVFVRYGNHRVDEGADLHVYIPADEPSERTVEQSYRPRIGRGPMAEQRSFPEREIAFEAVQASHVRDNEVARILDVTAGEQELEIVDLETETSYIAMASVNRLVRQGPGFGVWEGTFTVREPAKALTATTSASGPLEVYGNTFALPTVTFQPNGGTVRWRRLTATDNTGRGLANHPIRFEFDSTGVDADQPENFIVFYGPRPVPFHVIDAGTAETKLWLRMDLPAGGEAHVTVFYGSSVSNDDTANEYLSGGMDLVTSTNTQWTWNDWRIQEFPNANGVWQPAIFPPVHNNCDVSLQTAFGAELTALQEQSPEISGDRSNALVMTTGVPASNDNALRDLNRTIERLSGDGTVNFQIRYQRSGSTEWPTAWNEPRDSSGVAVFDSDVDVAGASTVLATIQGNENNDARMLIGSGVVDDDAENAGQADTFETDRITGQDWNNPNNALTESSSASATLSPGAETRYLAFSDFGFNIPSGAVVIGVEVRILRAGTQIHNRSIRLMQSNQVVGQEVSEGNWGIGTTPVWDTLGSPSDTWGLSLTPAAVNDSGFGFAIAVRNSSASNTRTANVDYQEIIVYYIDGGDQPTLHLDATEVPDTTIGTATDARILDGEFTVTHPDAGSTVITFDQLYMSDTDLTIDCDDMRLWVDDDTWFTPGRGVAFTDKFRWLGLNPGKHTVSHDLDASYELSWRDRLEL